jgi:tRNA(His) 5'-end guanylyltransferase
MLKTMGVFIDMRFGMNINAVPMQKKSGIITKRSPAKNSLPLRTIDMIII